MKDSFEKGKFLQTLTKENIQSEGLPELEVSTTSNNIIVWVERISRKFYQVEKDYPQLMLNFIYTVKKLAGPLSILVATKDTLEEIFGCLVTKYIHGSSGLIRLYNLQSMKDSYALDSGAFICNIENFLRTTAVILRLDIMQLTHWFQPLQKACFCTMICNLGTSIVQNMQGLNHSRVPQSQKYFA